MPRAESGAKCRDRHTADTPPPWVRLPPYGITSENMSGEHPGMSTQTGNLLSENEQPVIGDY